MPLRMIPNLYFIALLPEKSFSDKIRLIQEDLKEKFGLKYAMRLPPHITLQSPFECNSQEQEVLVGCTSSIRQKLAPIQLRTSNFGSFIQSVVYAAIEPTEALLAMQQDIVDALEVNGCLAPGQRNNSYIPHITLAHRDLETQRFLEVWKNFDQVTWIESFSIERLVIYKHEEGRWMEFVSMPLTLELV